MSQHMRTVDALLREQHGYPLVDFIADQRDAGLSWEAVARHLYAQTDGVVEVTGKTVERWARSEGIT